MKRWLPIASVTVFAFICFYLFYSTYKQVKDDAIRDLNKQQKAHARLAKAGIEGFASHYFKMLDHMTQHDDIIDMNDHGKKTIRDFFEVSRGDIRSITRVNSSGRFIYTFPDNEKYSGADISHRDFFKIMKRDLKPVISDVITSIKGEERSIVFHVPVLKKGKFFGSVAAVVSIDDLSTKYLKDIRIGKTGYAWVLSQKGTELYCPVPGHIGVSIYETSGRFPSVIAMAEEMMKGREGTTTYVYDYIAEKETRIVLKHAVYMPIVIGDTFWSIVVATPEEEALAAMKDFRNRWFMIIGFLIAGVFAFSFYLVRSWAVVGEARRRMAAEEASRQSAERYRSIFENSVEGIFQSTPEGRLVTANPALARMTGYDSPQEMMAGITDIGRQVYADPRDRETFLTIIREKGSVANYEVRFRQKDGREIWVSLNVRLIKDENGKPLYFEGTVEDITERKTAEAMLREEMEFNKTLLQASPAFFVAMDSEGKVILMNQSMLDALGYTIDEVTGKEYLSCFVPEEDRQALLAVFNQIVISMGSTRNVNRILKKDGGQLLVEWYGRPVRNTEGKLQYFFGVGIDITESKRTQEALKAEKDRFQALSENSPFGMVLISAEGRFDYLNPKFIDMFGYDINDVPDGRTWFEKAYPDKDYRVMAKSAWKEDFKGVNPGEKRPRVFNVHCKDGQQKVINFISIKLATGDYLMACEDMTELRRLEGQLRQSQKMEAIGNLAGGIAHDFNNILTTIMGYGSLLQEEVDKESHQRLYVEQILSASQKAANLTQGLLAFSRQKSVSLKPVDLNGSIRDAEKLLKRLLTEDIELKLLLAEGNTTVLADPTQIDQILFNLITNSRDAIARGGLITIETGLTYMDDEYVRAHGYGKEGHYVTITVSDTGAGMNESTRDKIFDPFFTTKEVGKGTGLGLATVYGIVNQHNGYITVYSEPNKGTTIRIYLPATDHVVEESRQNGISFKKGNETIMIAEDNKAVRDLIVAVLTRNGYRTLEAQDGEYAVDVFNANRDIALAILDSVMPKMNGREVYEEIRRIDPNIKVLFISGHTKDTVLDRGIADEDVDFLPKPVAPARLLGKIREILDRN